MIAAIRENNPGNFFIEPMSLAHGGRQEVPQGSYAVEIGTAKIVRQGTSITFCRLGLDGAHSDSGRS